MIVPSFRSTPLVSSVCPFTCFAIACLMLRLCASVFPASTYHARGCECLLSVCLSQHRSKSRNGGTRTGHGSSCAANCSTAFHAPQSRSFHYRKGSRETGSMTRRSKRSGRRSTSISFLFFLCLYSSFVLFACSLFLLIVYLFLHYFDSFGVLKVDEFLMNQGWLCQDWAVPAWEDWLDRLHWSRHAWLNWIKQVGQLIRRHAADGPTLVSSLVETKQWFSRALQCQRKPATTRMCIVYRLRS